MDFSKVKYQHIERWDTEETQYLKNSKELYIEPKLDGTNGVVCYDSDKNEIRVCSRNRFISVDDDNQGFAKYITENNLFKNFYSKEENRKYIIYGEFTCRTTYTVDKKYLKQFYIFDVYNIENKKYLKPEEYSELLPEYNKVPFAKVEVKDIENVKDSFKGFSKFLLPENFEHGEGFVIKDFSDSVNQYGRKTWGKILYEKPVLKSNDIYQIIFDKFFTDAFIDKEWVKYQEKYKEDFENGSFKKEGLKFKAYSIISNEFIKEEIANIIFKCKFPVINFAALRDKLIGAIEKYLKEKNDTENN